MDEALRWLPLAAAPEEASLLATRRAVERPAPAAPKRPHMSWRQQRVRAEELLAARFAAARAEPLASQALVLVEATSSVDRGLLPEEGPEATTFLWQDVVTAAPPAKLQPGAVGGYTLGHTVEADPKMRITYSTLVHARGDVAPTGSPPATLRVMVDCRVSVEKRVLLERMQRLRRSAARRAPRRRDALARRLARHRYAVRRWPRPLLALAYIFIGLERKAGAFYIGTTTRVTSALIEIPDMLVGQVLRADHHINNRLRRHSLWRGLHDPRSLTTEQRGLMLFLTALVVLGAVLALNSFFALAYPEGAPAYRHVLFNAGAQFVSQFGVPFFVEPVLLLSIPSLGPVLAVAGFVVGKLLGVWVLYLLGASLHGQLVRWTTGRPRAERLVGWLTRNGDKWGFAILFLDNVIPLMPDQVQIVFAVSGVRFRAWIGGIMGGTLLKFGIILVGYYLVGPARVAQFFSNPFA
ncbi:MAG TPA: hypothetical protein VGR28_11830 [Candidatus Thermoplasmatota archaeon]|nr:hypothetical protein [Candidatus Thermoplasmatota archaeon]